MPLFYLPPPPPKKKKTPTRELSLNQHENNFGLNFSRHEPTTAFTIPVGPCVKFARPAVEPVKFCFNFFLDCIILDYMAGHPSSLLTLNYS